MCHQTESEGIPTVVYRFACEELLEGQYVSFQRDTTGILEMRMIMVFLAKNIGAYGESFTHFQEFFYLPLSIFGRAGKETLHGLQFPQT